MPLARFFKILIFVTMLSLVYIHMQVQIIGLAYEGKDNEKSMRKLAEVNGHLQYKILCLTSSHNLGVKMLAENSKMEFMGSQDIVHVSSTSHLTAVSPHNIEKTQNNSLLGLLSFAKDAEAKQE